MLLKWDVLAGFGYATLFRELNMSVFCTVDRLAEQQTTELVTAIARACRFYPKSAACLQRSVALAWMLRKRGIAADLKIGVRQFPFLSHAWVEVAGKIINDVEQVRETYAPLHEFKAIPSQPRRS